MLRCRVGVGHWPAIALLPPPQSLWDKLHETAFQGSSLALSALGTEESLKAITSDDLAAFVKANYTGSRVVVSGAGVEHAQVCVGPGPCMTSHRSFMWSLL